MHSPYGTQPYHRQQLLDWLHDLTDDWSLASTHFGARLRGFFY